MQKIKVLELPTRLCDNNKAYLIKTLLKPDSTFIDVGACLGCFTKIAAEALGKNGKLIAFEPSKKVYNKMIIGLKPFLKESAARGCKFWLEQIALSNFEGTTELFTVVGKTGWSTIIPNKRKGAKESVDVTTLDDYLKTVNINRVDMIKIDVEGSDLEVLYGAKHTIENSKPLFLLVELHLTEPYKVPRDELFNFFKNYNISIYSVITGKIIDVIDDLPLEIIGVKYD